MFSLKNPKSISLILVFLVFALVFGSVSFVNHYNFRTFALDLGMFNNAIYDFAHFRTNYCKVLLQETPVNFLGCHFSLLPVLFSPLYWLFGSYTMLIIQIAAILLGGFGIYKLSQRHLNNKWTQIIIVVQFFSIWGIYSALAFDYHDNVVAAMLVPWLIYFFEKEQIKKFTFIFILILLSKENMAIWLVFILAGMALVYRRTRVGKIKYGLIAYALAAITYFVIVTKIFMPYLNPDGFEQLSRYSHLGSSFTEILSTFITKPKLIFTLLFENITADPFFNKIKSELHFMVLVSGGIALIFKPRFLIFLLPIYAQKLFSNDMVLWGINAHYSIEFVPVMGLALIFWLKDFKEIQSIYISASIALITLISTISTIDSRESKWYNPVNSMFYASGHYTQNFDRSKVYERLGKIPAKAIISAHSPIIPHIAFREAVYHFPYGLEHSDHVIVFRENESYYPLSKEEFHNKLEELIVSGKWAIDYDENNLIILTRRK